METQIDPKDEHVDDASDVDGDALTNSEMDRLGFDRPPPLLYKRSNFSLGEDAQERNYDAGGSHDVASSCAVRTTVDDALSHIQSLAGNMDDFGLFGSRAKELPSQALEAHTSKMRDAMQTPVTENDNKGIDEIASQIISESKTTADDNDKANLKAKETIGVLEAAIARGKVPSREHRALYARWRRSMPYGFSALSNAEKRRVQLEFMNSELQSQEAVLKKTTTLQKFESTTSTMMTFGKIVVEYGGWGWPPAIEGAKRTAIRCAFMGGTSAHGSMPFQCSVHC